VLEGSLRKAANQTSITGYLIDTAPGAQVSADRFDGGLGASFDTPEHDRQVAHAGIAALNE
jgi:TolB-like protein